MPDTPEVVVFDVVETLFSLETLRGRFERAGLKGHQLETWFAQMLRDAFTLEIAGRYAPFREIASSALAAMMGGRDEDRIASILDGFKELRAEDDVAPAMRALRDADRRIVALTNGHRDTTRTLLEQAGLDGMVERVMSIDEIGHWKPRREVYEWCAREVSAAPSRLALVAAHGWDLQGARRAGLVTAFVGRRGAVFPPVMEAPDVTGGTLIEVTDRLLAL